MYRLTKNEGKTLQVVNGGSAADAQRIAGKFVSRFAFVRPVLANIASKINTSILMAIGNDYDYKKLFARQVQALCQNADVFLGRSTSDKSQDNLLAFKEVRLQGLICIGLTGNCSGPILELCNYLPWVSPPNTPKIQEGHLVLGHVLFGSVENTIFTAPE